MSEQLQLFDLPEDAPKKRAEWRADSVANFNLLATGSYDKAIDAIQADIQRDHDWYERAMKDFRETLRLRGMAQDGNYPDSPKLPVQSIRVKQMAIAKLQREKPTPQDLWPGVQS